MYTVYMYMYIAVNSGGIEIVKLAEFVLIHVIWYS